MLVKTCFIKAITWCN